jgi:hypothetical protein
MSELVVTTAGTWETEDSSPLSCPETLAAGETACPGVAETAKVALVVCMDEKGKEGGDAASTGARIALLSTD